MSFESNLNKSLYSEQYSMLTDELQSSRAVPSPNVGTALPQLNSEGYKYKSPLSTLDSMRTMSNIIVGSSRGFDDIYRVLNAKQNAINQTIAEEQARLEEEQLRKQQEAGLPETVMQGVGAAKTISDTVGLIAGEEAAAEVATEVTAEAVVAEGATEAVVAEGATEAVVAEGATESVVAEGATETVAAYEGSIAATAVPVAAVVAGTYLTVEGVKDLVNGENDTSAKGTAARVQTALSTFGFSEVFRALGVFSKPKTKVEEERLTSFYNNEDNFGYKFGPPAGLDLETGKFKDESRSGKQQAKDNAVQFEVSEDFRGWKDGQFINNKALSSGKESDLTGIDISGYAAVLQGVADSGVITKDMDYLEILEQQMTYSDKALAAGAVREHHGTIDIDKDKLAAFEAENPDFKGTSWDEFKYNTSVQSVLSQGVPWREELARRKDMEPEWTDWDKVEQDLVELEKKGKV